jgi:ribonuclease R
MTKAWAPPTREAILGCLRDAGSPLTPAELIERLAVAPGGVEILERRLAAMERDGQLIPNRKGLLLLASKLDFVAGRIVGHRDGFGFLVPDQGGSDYFLSLREMQKAMHGDRVLIKRSGVDSRGRAEGVIVEVTERAHRSMVGRFVNERGVDMVVPEDQRIKHDILIAPGDAAGAQPGQVVIVEITDPPSSHCAPIGRVIEVLGDLDDPGMEIEIAVRKFDVPHQFSEASQKAAAVLPTAVRPVDLKGRVDLRDVPLVTIDGEDARDFDDAVYCEPMGEASRRASSMRLIVAIADVGHYVRPADAIDAEAVLRSTSVYFPRRVIPMLPETLSNGLCSLNPLTDRLVLVCDMVVTTRGDVKAYQFYEAVMHSAARLTYDEVWGILSGRDLAAVRRHAALVPQLQHLHDIFRMLLRARKARGALDLDTVETRMVCDTAGRIEKIVPRHRNDAHRLIEECMLAANVCAADFMKRSKHPGLYRVHEGPTPEKLALLREFLRTVGLTLGGGADPSPKDYAELGVRIKERPDASLLQAMLLRSMRQAVYSPDNLGHFGLAFDAYAHFTSPIRRYPDLMTHRVIKALLRGERHRPPPLSSEEVAAGERGRRGRGRGQVLEAAGPPQSHGEEHELWTHYGMQCSAHERRADDASRDVEAWLKCQFMRARVGEQFAGRITGAAPFGVFVTLDELHVDGLLHVSELGSEYFQYNEAAHELRGERTGLRYRLTDELHVQVSRVDLEARRIEFRLVHKLGPHGPVPVDPTPAAGRKVATGKSRMVDEVGAQREAAHRAADAPQQPGVADQSGRRGAKRPH